MRSMSPPDCQFTARFAVFVRICTGSFITQVSLARETPDLKGLDGYEPYVETE
jgi:hypothetical protein